MINEEMATNTICTYIKSKNIGNTLYIHMYIATY